MDEIKMRKILLENMTKMLTWISNEFMKADCDVPYVYKFHRGFIYGHPAYDCLEFRASKDAKFRFVHYGGGQEVTKDGKMYDDGEEYSQKFFTNLDWYIPKENVEGFREAMEEWPRVKASVSKYLEEINNLSNFEL